MLGLPSLMVEGLPTCISWGISVDTVQCVINLQPITLSRRTVLKEIAQFNSVVRLLHATRKAITAASLSCD